MDAAVGLKRPKEEDEGAHHGDCRDDLPLPAPKRKPAKKAKTATPIEKRPAVFRPTASKAICERITRVLKQRMYLVSRSVESATTDDGSPAVSKGTFAVLGSTGNVYTVTITAQPSCSCPDFQKRGDPCKHLLFVFLKVLGRDQHDPMIWQKGLLQSEVNDALSRMAQLDERGLRGVLANQRVRSTYAQLETSQDEEEEKMEMREVDDECPICFEDIGGGEGGKKKQEALVVCGECRRPVHKDCFEQWKRSKAQEGEPVTCVYCRADWAKQQEAKLPKIAGVESPEGYVNLGQLQGQRKTRDESTYAEWYRNRPGARGRGRRPARPHNPFDDDGDY